VSKVIAKARAKLPPGQQDALNLAYSEYLSAMANAGPETEKKKNVEWLTNNLGVPILVIGCKADKLESETFEQQQRLQFIQQHLRNCCLPYGAGLLYCSSHGGTNMNLLHRYLLHRLYPDMFSLKDEAKVANDSVFIPSGWDSPSLIEDLKQAKSPWEADATYDQVIRIPTDVLEAEVKQARAKTTDGEKEEDRLPPDEDWLETLHYPKAENKTPIVAKKKEVDRGDNKAAKKFFESLLTKKK